MCERKRNKSGREKGTLCGGRETKEECVREKIKVNEGEKVRKVEGNCGYKDERKGRRENE